MTTLKHFDLLLLEGKRNLQIIPGNDIAVEVSNMAHALPADHATLAPSPAWPARAMSQGARGRGQKADARPLAWCPGTHL